MRQKDEKSNGDFTMKHHSRDLFSLLSSGAKKIVDFGCLLTAKKLTAKLIVFRDKKTRALRRALPSVFLFVVERKKLGKVDR